MVQNEAKDAELWHAVRNGDGDALETLFERHGRAVYNFCFRRTASWSDAEDLTSDVFLAAWQKRRSVMLGTDASLLPWLLGTATNLIRNRSRRLARFTRAMTQLRSQHEREGDRTEELIARLDDEQGMGELVARLSRLPRREQEALALYAWADLAYEEIAKALGVPVGTVRSRIARGRERLTLAGGGRSDINRSVPEGSVHVDQ